MEEHTFEADDFLNALLLVDRDGAEKLVFKMMNDSAIMKDIEIMVINALKTIGDGWEEGEYSLAQVYMAGIICEELIAKLFPETERKRIDTPKIGIGVFQDHHTLGKRMVKSVILASGYNVQDIGQGLNVDDFVDACLGNKYDVMLISTLMLPSALKIQQVKEKFQSLGIQTKIIAGGAPFRFDPLLWQKVGADADGGEATNIMTVIESVVNII